MRGFAGRPGFDRARQLHRIKSKLLPKLVSRLEHFIKLLVLRRIDQAALEHRALQIRRAHPHQPNLLLAIPGVGKQPQNVRENDGVEIGGLVEGRVSRQGLERGKAQLQPHGAGKEAVVAQAPGDKLRQVRERSLDFFPFVDVRVESSLVADRLGLFFVLVGFNIPAAGFGIEPFAEFPEPAPAASPAPSAAGRQW